jgi:hypothetical protein
MRVEFETGYRRILVERVAPVPKYRNEWCDQSTRRTGGELAARHEESSMTLCYCS